MSDPPSPPPCPACGKPRDAAFRPFCSRRCADLDLHRWLSNRYAIPARDDDEDHSAEDGRGDGDG